MRLAYLSQGRLFLCDNGETPRLIESEYGREVVQRSLRKQSKNNWKSQGEGALFSRGSLWGVANEDPSSVRVAITAVTKGAQEKQLFYALDTGTVGGLFSFDPEGNKENRLFHREHLHLNNLTQSLEHNLLACSQNLTNGTANIAICRTSDVDVVTEGDSVDQAPSWIPGPKKQLVFQSAGIARNQGGLAVGFGPFSIQKLDLETGEMATLKEDNKYDFLSPRINRNGQLFYIRRPYEKPGAAAYPPTKFLTDTFLFPFRLLRALFHYLNFFSLVYSKKPLTTASGPKVETPDQKTLLLQGKIIDAEKAMKEGIQEEGVKSLVPATWQLIKQEPSGAETAIAKAVLAFDLDPDGQVLYSNGNAIYRLGDTGTTELLLKADFIETVLSLG